MYWDDTVGEWQEAVGEQWTINVLCFSYCIPFHTLPPSTGKPSVPSYSSGTLKAQALHDDVNIFLRRIY